MTRTGLQRTARLHRKDGYWQGQFTAMGSPCELLTEADDEAPARLLLDLVSTEAWRIEDKFSRYLSDNIVDRINTSDGEAITVDDETANLLDFAQSLYDMSESRFDITSGVLRQVWTFDGSDHVPTSEQIAAVLDVVGWSKLEWQRPELAIRPGMQIDLGGIGKEYAVDRTAVQLGDATESSCLVNFGGDLVVTSEPANSDGWQVGIEALAEDEQIADRVIRLQQGAIATSGDARRFVLRDGIRYSHILDPTTGWPVEDVPRSITVAADTCTQAGMLATLAMLRGAEAESFLQQQEVQFWCLR